MIKEFYTIWRYYSFSDWNEKFYQLDKLQDGLNNGLETAQLFDSLYEVEKYLENKVREFKQDKFRAYERCLNDNKWKDNDFKENMFEVIKIQRNLRDQN